MCELEYRFAEPSDVCSTHVGIAGSEAGRYAGKTELVSALLFYL